MLFILDMKMKAFATYSQQKQYNRTTSLLIVAQTWRLVGIVFLWGMTQGFLDPAMAIPNGVGDILVGATAIPFAIFLLKGYTWSKYALVVWNVLGIADLVMAVTLGFITSPDFGVSTMTTIPWVFIPAIAVPATLALHVITLYRLRNTAFE
jgi:hypothetical protein